MIRSFLVEPVRQYLSVLGLEIPISYRYNDSKLLNVNGADRNE